MDKRTFIKRWNNNNNDKPEAASFVWSSYEEKRGSDSEMKVPRRILEQEKRK